MPSTIFSIRYGRASPKAFGLALAALGVAALTDCHGRDDVRTRERALGSGTALAVPGNAPSPMANLVADLDADAARHANAAVAFSKDPIEVAPPLVEAKVNADVGAADTALECLTAAVYYEAGGETLQGRRAVAQVVLNRVRHPSFPKTVCGVVYQGAERRTGCQFTFTCDGSLARATSPSLWKKAEQVARQALAGMVEPSVGLATHYHADWVFPYWAPNLRKIAQVGSHIFYTWPGAWGRRRAFTQAPVWLDPLVPPVASVAADGNDQPTAPPAAGLRPRLAADAEIGTVVDAPRLDAGPAITPVADKRRGTLVIDGLEAGAPRP